jgi:hypothetical protein
VYFISYPDEVHQSASSHLQMIVYESVPTLTFPHKFLTGSTTFNCCNLLGCALQLDRIHQKEADGGVRLNDRFCCGLFLSCQSLVLIDALDRNPSRTDFDGQYFPEIQIEVAHHYESLFLLLCESAAWLIETTDVQYVFALKVACFFSPPLVLSNLTVYIFDDYVRFFIFQRRTIVVPKLVHHFYYGHPIDEFGLRCFELDISQFNPPSNNQKPYLENLFGFNILCDLSLTVDNYQTQNLVYSLNYGITVDLEPFFVILFHIIAYDDMRQRRIRPI